MFLRMIIECHFGHCCISRLSPIKKSCLLVFSVLPSLFLLFAQSLYSLTLWKQFCCPQHHAAKWKALLAGKFHLRKVSRSWRWPFGWSLIFIYCRGQHYSHVFMTLLQPMITSSLINLAISVLKAAFISKQHDLIFPPGPARIEKGDTAKAN